MFRPYVGGRAHTGGGRTFDFNERRADMSWFSKHAGAVVGALTGVPTAALIGANYDRNKANHTAPAGGYNDWYKANKSDIGLLRNNPSSLSEERMRAMLAAITSTGDWKTNSGVMKDVEALRGHLSAYDAMHAQEEYQGAMLEMYDRMAKASEAAANRAAQYEQPINDVSVSAAYAKADREAENRQALRRGLLSLTRFGDQAKMQTLGAA